MTDKNISHERNSRLSKGISSLIEKEETNYETRFLPPSEDDFRVKTETEVIRVPNCSYAGESVGTSKFFLCPCKSSAVFEPICEACAKTCHKNHYPSLVVPGQHICNCGFSNHTITEEMDQAVKEKLNNSKNYECFYTRLFDIVPNKGYYLYKDTVYCSVCIEYCKHLSFDNPDLTPCESEKMTCHCNNYHELNFIKLNAEFLTRTNFHTHMRLFNYNILIKCKASYRIYISPLLKMLNEYLTKKGPKANLDFFGNFMVFKILQLFSAFSVYWENKFWCLPSKFTSQLNNTKDLLELMSLNDLTDNLDEESLVNLVTCKFYFAELLFNKIIRSHVINNNNLWNAKTIINMNLYQRYIYFHCGRIFYIFNGKLNENSDIEDYISSVLELYQKILMLDEKFPKIFDCLVSYVFPTFNRILKYIIKYNICSKENRKKYFNLVYATMEIWTTKGVGDFKDSSLYIIKSILYTIIYKQDEACFDFFQGNEIFRKKRFMFQINEESTLLTKIFLLIIKENNRIHLSDKAIIVDFYLQKILELLTDKEDFYMNCINNLNIKELEFLKMNVKTTDTINNKVKQIEEIKTNINKEFKDKITEFTSNFAIINRDYFNFECDQDNYFKSATEILSKFNQFIKSEKINIDEIYENYNCYNPNENRFYLNKLNTLRDALFYSTFFQKLEEFLHIYNCSKIYKKSEEELNYNNDLLIENIKNLLQFIYIICKDPNYLVLIMNIKSDIFAVTFNDTIDTLIPFLERIIEMIYSQAFTFSFKSINPGTNNASCNEENLNLESKFYNNQLNLSAINREEEGNFQKEFKLHNTHFISEVICKLIDLNTYNLPVLENLMLISKKLLKNIEIKRPNYYDIVDAFTATFRKFNSDDKITNKIDNYFKDAIEKTGGEAKYKNAPRLSKQKFEYSKEEKDQEEFKETSRFIYVYFDFVCELYLCDAYFHGSLAKCYLLPYDKLQEYFFKLCDIKFETVPIEVEYAISRYYFTVAFPLNFQMNTINRQLKNLFMEKVPDNLYMLHLCKKLEKDKHVNKITEILELARKLTKVFDNFSIKRLFSYSNYKNDSRFIYRYYENLILRPLFKLFNLYILDLKNITRNNLYIFFRLIFLFLKITVEFYKCNKPDEKIRSSDVLIFDFEEFTIKNELTKSNLEDIYNDAKIFSDYKIHFFELQEIYNIYERNIRRIIKLKRSEISFLRTMSATSNLSNSSYLSYTSHLENLLLNSQNNLIESYNELKEKTYENNLSLVKSYKDILLENDHNIAEDLTKYFLEKLFDKLTTYNTDINEDLENYDLFIANSKKKITIFKPQNAYIFVYLNGFFYNDVSAFQDAFSSIKIPSNFYDFIIEKIIVGGTFNEIQKLLDIDYLENTKQKAKTRTLGKYQTVAFNCTTQAIKFLQNLCEGHNKEFQSKFFNYLMDPNEYLYNNKNIYLEVKVRESYARLIYQGSQLIKGRTSKDKISPVEEEKKLEGFLERIVNYVNNKHDKHDSSSNNEENESASDFNPIEHGFVGKLKDLEEKHVSFFNLICYLMELINVSLNVKEGVNIKLLKKISTYKNYDNINEIYVRFSDLIVEMVQGTDLVNLENFYVKSLPINYQLFKNNGEFIKNEDNRCFIFMYLAEQIMHVVFSEEKLFDPVYYTMKKNLFITMNNILIQDNEYSAIFNCFRNLFPPKKLISIISIYLRGIYVKHCFKINYSHSNFSDDLKYTELNMKELEELETMFKDQPKIFEDDYFILASQMFLFLTISAEKFKNPDSQKIMTMAMKNTEDSKITDTKEGSVNIAEDELDYFSSIIKYIINKAIKGISLKRVKPKDHNYTNDIIITVKFFNEVIRKCEFNTPGNHNKLVLKRIYFIVDPHYYFISKNSIENFRKNVNRTSASSKLKGLMSALNVFISEIRYKNKIFRKSRYIKDIIDINYRDVDFFNFCVSLIINFILLLFLKDVEEGITDSLDILIKIIVSLQTIMNISFIYIFYRTKYKFYLSLNLKAIGKVYNDLTLPEKIKVNYLDSFLLNDEIYAILIIMIIGTLGVISKYGVFFFSLQLLSCIKFIDTIKEIILAFKIRFTQLLCIVGFLAILIYFYSNIGFYFLIDEFNFDYNGQDENYCQTLLECLINYFNHGVRAPGGIGDILQPKSYDYQPALYMFRFINDLIFYITIVLLLLNMINGVIITTFSQIREDSKNKETDRKNKCFICNIDRLEFEKKKINFDDHQKYEHNLMDYIKFFVFIKRIDEMDMDADQSFIDNCLKENDIKFFPVNCSLSTGEIKNEA